jgi:predicted PurR-regulated permease PerM
MEEKELKKVVIPLFILALGVVSYFVIAPLITYIFLGLLFAYIFYSPFQQLAKRLKSDTWSAVITVASSILVFIIPPLLLIPILVRQLFEAYISIRGADFAAIIFKIFPSLTASSSISAEVIATMSHFSAKISDILFQLFESTFQNIPMIIAGVLVLIFTFYFGLKEGSKFQDYISSVLPLPKDQKKKLYDRFEQVTDSVIFGQAIIGVAQGLIAGIAYFMFGIPNALLLTVVTILASALPVIGPWLVWVPIDIFLFINGNQVAGMQLLVYGLFVINWVETFLRPVVIAERAEMNAAIALIGAIGGVYAFGIMGFIIGPLVLAYLILLIEMYKEDKSESIVIKEEKLPESSESKK